MKLLRLLLASLMLSLTIVFGCVETKPKPLKELASASTPPVAETASKPSPRTLAVHVDMAGGVTLNQASMGTVDHTEQLSERLKQIFAEREREREHVYEPGSERIAKAVFVTAPRAAPYSTVTKVIEAIRSAGGAPIGLQLEDK